MHGFQADMMKTFDNGISNIHRVRPGTHHRSHTIEIVENFRSKFFLTISNPEHPRQQKTGPRPSSKDQEARSKEQARINQGWKSKEQGASKDQPRMKEQGVNEDITWTKKTDETKMVRVRVRVRAKGGSGSSSG